MLLCTPHIYPELPNHLLDMPNLYLRVLRTVPPCRESVVEQAVESYPIAMFLALDRGTRSTHAQHCEDILQGNEPER